MQSKKSAKESSIRMVLGGLALAALILSCATPQAAGSAPTRVPGSPAADAAPQPPTGPALASGGTATPAEAIPRAGTPAPDSQGAVAPPPAAPAPTPPPAPAAPVTPPAPAASPRPAPESPAPPSPAPPSSAPPSLAPSPVARALGEIVYVEGDIEIRRGTRIIRGPEADIGARVLPFDLLVTGPKARAEVELDSSKPGGALLKVGERSAFYFDSKELDDGSRSGIVRLLAGSLAIKVEKLGGGGFTVAANGSTMGVRGTVFSVDVTADGSTLVACAEGRVSCVGPDGKEYLARPGLAVEGLAGPGAAGSALSGGLPALGPRALPATSLSGYRATWLVDRLAGLEKGGAILALELSRSLGAAGPDFERAYARLAALGPTLDAWERALAGGRSFRFEERLEEKKAVAGALFDCMKALPAYERPYYRLRDLAARRAEGLILGGSLPAGSPGLETLFATFAEASRGAEDRMAAVRRAMALFARAAGESPLGTFFAERSGAAGPAGLLGPGSSGSLLEIGE